MAGQRHRKVIVGISLLIILFILGCDLSGARKSKPKSYSNTLSTPEEVVALFCDMDFSGKRLSSLTWSEILPYTTWPDEPGWDTVLVVSKYSLSDVKRSNNTADITVEYHVVGKYGTELLQMDKIEKVPFKVIKTENGWKIKSPDWMMPHVSPMTLLSNLEGRLKEERDSSISNRLRQEIAILHASQSPKERQTKKD
jgi:hypothetical protein